MVLVVALLGAGCVFSDKTISLKWNDNSKRPTVTYIFDHTNFYILDSTNNVIWRTNFDKDMGHFVMTNVPTWTCGDAIESEAKSPDGNWIAAVYVRDCGATDSFSSQINLRPSKAAFDDDDPQAFFIMDGLPRLSVSWVSNKEILVRYPKLYGQDHTIYRREIERNGITITYETFFHL
jgi:hypothetical protein